MVNPSKDKKFESEPVVVADEKSNTKVKGTAKKPKSKVKSNDAKDNPKKVKIKRATSPGVTKVSGVRNPDSAASSNGGEKKTKTFRSTRTTVDDYDIGELKSDASAGYQGDIEL